MKNSEIRKKYLEYKNYINDINGLNKDAKIVLSDNINIINKLIEQFETLYGQDYDSIKDAIEGSKDLQKNFNELINTIGKEKEKLDELNQTLEEQRNNYKITADEQKRCLEYATKIKKLGIADEFEEANTKLAEYQANMITLTQDEIDKYQEIVDREQQLQHSLGIRNTKQKEYIKDLTESHGILSQTLDDYYSLEETNNRITTEYKKQLRLKTEEDNISKRRGKMFDNYLKILKSSWGIIKNWSSEWMTFNDLTVKSGRAIGMSNANLRNYNLKLIKDTTELSHLYGVTREQWLGFQTAYAESTSKAIVLTQGELENIGAVSKLTSEEIVNQAVNNMDVLGGSSDNAMAQVAMTHQRAMLLGLNASKLAKDTVKNWSLAQKFNFRNGVDGISRMTALSERLKFNLESIANVAENMQSIEGSIQTTARLQMLGGQFARNFSNPMDVMFESNYDLEALTKRITDTFAGQGVFNSKTGKVDISPINQRFIREASKALGISFDEAINMATQNVKYDKVMSEVNPLTNFDENQKESIANLAKWDNEKKEHYVTIQTKEGETKNVAIKDLTAEQIDAARSLEANTADINKNVYEISNGVNEILNIARERASDQRSMIEKLLGVKESFKGIKANSTDWYMHPIDNQLNSSTKRGGIINNGFDIMQAIGGWMLPIVLASVGGFKYWKATKFRKYDGSFTQFVKNWFSTKRTSSERAASGATPKKGFFNRVGSKFKALVPKLGKKGRIGLAVAGASALWYTLSSFTNKPNDVDIIKPNSNLNETNDTQLLELKKQTALLKEISENKAISKVTYDSKELNNDYGTSIKQDEDSNLTKDIAIGAGTFAGYMALDKGTSYLAKNAQNMSKKNGIIGKIGKIGLKASPKLLRGFSIGGLAVDGLNLVGKATGLYEEGSTTDKLMNIGSSALTGAGIGSFAGPIGSAVGAVIGAGVGVVSEYGENIKKWFTKTTNNAKIQNVGLNRTLESPYVQSLPVVGQPTQIINETYREVITEKIVIPDINLNVNGTIKLTNEGGKNANVDIEKLLNNQQFKNMLIKMVKDGLDKNQNNGKIDRNGLSNMRVSSGYANK